MLAAACRRSFSTAFARGQQCQIRSVSSMMPPTNNHKDDQKKEDQQRRRRRKGRGDR